MYQYFGDLRIDAEFLRDERSLHTAAEENNVRFLENLISAGANVDTKNHYGSTPLHCTAHASKDDSHFEVAELLLKNGANVNARDRHGETPLFGLVKSENIETIKLLVNYGADFNAACIRMRCNILFPAIDHSTSLDIFKLLVDLGVDINHRNYVGDTPLHYAAKNNSDESNLEMIELMLKNGADPNFRDSIDSTPFYSLVQSCNVRMVQLFLDYNADCRVLNNFGHNLLFPAVMFNKNVETVQFLIDLGLNVNLACKRGKTPLQSAYYSINPSNESIKIIKCLMKNGAVIDPSFFKTNRRPQYFWEMILRHLAKLNFENISAHSVYLDYVSQRDQYDEYYERCREELVLAKRTKVQNCRITYYDLLVGSNRMLKNYSGNVDFLENVHDFWNNNCLKQFPIYGPEIKDRVRKGIKRRELYNKTADLLSDCLPIFSPTHLIIRDTLDYVLCKKDLSKFCGSN